MIHKLMQAALISLLALQASAQDAMTDEERAAFRAEVRAYLLENPEVLMEAIGVLEARQATAQAEADAALVQSVMDDLVNDGVSYIGGNPDGDVTLIEFMDYRCGYCKRAFPEVERLIADDGNIRYVIKEFPILGEQSVLASRFAVATKLVAGDAAYKDVHNTLMEFRGDVTEPAVVEIAETFGLDTDAILDRMNTEEVTSILQANRALGETLSITGTPSFVIGDEMVRGYVPYDQMVEIVTELRS